MKLASKVIPLLLATLVASAHCAAQVNPNRMLSQSDTGPLSDCITRQHIMSLVLNSKRACTLVCLWVGFLSQEVAPAPLVQDTTSTEGGTRNISLSWTGRALKVR